MRTYLFEFTDVNKAIFISVKDLERFPKVGFHVIGPVSDDDEDDEDEDDDGVQFEILPVSGWIIKMMAIGNR